MKQVFFTLLFFIMASGCSVEPWVKPYELTHLADPIMSFDRDPISSAYINHIHDSHESARGADISSTGGGCGCN